MSFTCEIKGVLVDGFEKGRHIAHPMAIACEHRSEVETEAIDVHVDRRLSVIIWSARGCMALTVFPVPV